MITKVYITLGYACNMRCGYCSQVDHAKDMSKDWVIDYTALDVLIALPQELKIVFFGGEPLLYFDKVIAITDYLRKYKKNARIGLITNGKALSLDVAKACNTYGIHVTISHDGYYQLQNREIGRASCRERV